MLYLDVSDEGRLYRHLQFVRNSLLMLFRCPVDSIAYVTVEGGATPESEHVADVEDANTEEV